MRLRPIAILGCVIAVATTTVATAAPKAAPKPLCKVVVDPANDELSGRDVGANAVPGRPYDPSLDIVSADVANDATNLTAVIRVAKMTATDTMAPTGRYYAVKFDYRSSGLGSEAISAALTPTGNVFVGGSGRGVVDLAKSEIRITVPISRLTGHPLFKPGDALEHIIVDADLSTPAAPDATTAVVAQRIVLNATADYLGDRALTDKVYPVGAPSCVKVGA